MFFPEQKFVLPAAAEDKKDASPAEDETTEETADETAGVFLEDAADEPYAAWDDDTPHSEKMSKGRQGKQNRMMGGAGKGPKHGPSNFDLFSKKGSTKK